MQLVCPVCRETITKGSKCLESVSQYSDEEQEKEEEEVHISDQVQLWQQNMSRLLQHQRERGGTIDITAKDDVIDETWVYINNKCAQVLYE